jgi:serine protease Do
MIRRVIIFPLVSFALLLILAITAGCQQTTITVTITPPSTNGSGQIPPSFVDVAEKVRPSVVVIETNTAEGSGWIIDSDGIIVTNNHVVEGAESVFVTLDDGRTFPADLVSADPLTDIAIIRINAPNLSAASISDFSNLRVGQPVAAIGNSLGQGISLKGGWVSRLNTSVIVDDRWLFGLIETDAAINEGNSGGPLVNMNGEVIGITSVKLIGVEVEGIGYAISIETALPVIEDLITQGFVVHPYLGVGGLHTVDTAIVAFFELSIDRGVLLTSIVPGQPADAAGLESEDVIVAIDGEEIISIEQLVSAIRSREVGQQIEITYWRGNTQIVTHTTLVARPTG